MCFNNIRVLAMAVVLSACASLPTPQAVSTDSSRPRTGTLTLSFPSPGGEGETWDVLICDGDLYHRRTCDRGEGVRGGEDHDIPTVRRPAEILVRRAGRVVCPDSDQGFQDDTLRLQSAGIAFTDAEGGVHRFAPVDSSRGCDTTFRSVTDHPERIQVVMPDMAWCRVVYAHNERYTIVCSGR